MRQWAQSKDPRLQQKFIEVAYGKVPDIVEVSGGNEPLKIKMVWGDSQMDGKE